MTNTGVSHHRRIYVRFDNGSQRLLHPEVAPRVVGLDADGDVLVPLIEGVPDYLIALTPCCTASGKGSGVWTGVVCRSCYQVVDAKFGVRAELRAARV